MRKKKMKKVLLSVLFSLFAMVLMATSSSAMNSFNNDLNSTCNMSVGCGYCHVDSGGGGPLTAEGDTYLAGGACAICPNEPACAGGGTGACTDYTDKTTCNADAVCEWTGSPKNGSCGDAVVEPPPGGGACSDYTDRTACNADASCSWSGKNKICEDAGGGSTGGVTQIFTQARWGEYCTDPSGWVRKGYNVGIWPTNVPFKAQGLDSRGHKVATTYNWSATGQSGTMSVDDNTNNVYIAAPYAPDGNLNYTVTADGASGSGTLYRDPAACASCHRNPPGHIALEENWGRCHDCHNLGVVIHQHAVSPAGIADTDCYACHPTGCYNSDAHNSAQIGLWCTDCHGVLSDSLTGNFKISHQAGKPQCADCHASPYAETGMYSEAVGHGGMLCESCHGSPHRVQLPSIQCVDCHTEQANDNNMGPNCGSCHVSSVSPHLVRKQ